MQGPVEGESSSDSSSSSSSSDDDTSSDEDNCAVNPSLSGSRKRWIFLYLFYINATFGKPSVKPILAPMFVLAQQLCQHWKPTWTMEQLLRGFDRFYREIIKVLCECMVTLIISYKDPYRLRFTKFRTWLTTVHNFGCNFSDVSDFPSFPSAVVAVW